MSEQEKQPEQVPDMMALVEKYVPELKQGITQGELEGIIARLTMDKTVAERNMNLAIKKLVEAAQERDVLAGEVIALRAQVKSMAEAFKGKVE